jgi:hypothetical protein
VVAKLRSTPLGTTRGQAFGRANVVSKSRYNSGKSSKLVAEELGASDYVSLNLYHLKAGAQLYPCEMSAEKVIDFLGAYTLQPRNI